MKKIYLPTLKRVKISNYSLFRKDIDYEFILGLNLIIGGNGIGKTTFINIVKYALIGLYKKDLDVRVYKGEKRLILVECIVDVVDREKHVIESADF